MSRINKSGARSFQPQKDGGVAFMNKSQRTRFVLPTSVQEAEERRDKLILEIEDVNQQLGDPLRTDPSWRRRANVAKRLLEAELVVLTTWLQRPSASAAKIFVSRRGIATQLATQDAQVLQYLDLLNRSRALFQALADKGVEFDTTEQAVLLEIDRVLDSRKSVALAAARACVLKAQNPQDSVETWARIVQHTKDLGDLESLKGAIREWQINTKDPNSEGLWFTIVKAFLACGDVPSVVAAVERHSRPDRWKWVRTICLLFAHSKELKHLAWARTHATELESSCLGDAAFAWVSVFAVSGDTLDLDQAKKFFPSSLAALKTEKSLERWLGSFIRLLCETRDREWAADLLLQGSFSPTFQVEAYCALGHAFHDDVYLHRALAAAGSTKIEAFPFKTFADLVRLCASFGNVGYIKTMADMTTIPVARGYALSVAVAMQKPEARFISWFSNAETAIDQAWQSGSTASLDPARTAFVWALAVCGKTEKAMYSAGRMESSYSQCRGFLLIDTVQKGRQSIEDLAY